VSSEDIDKGARWSSDIAKELDSAGFGVIFVTKQNLSAPWINFEAGALSKTIDKAFVSPFLFEVKRSDVGGPLLQFQSTILERDDVLKLIKSINARCPEAERLKMDRLDKAFSIWWPELERELGRLERAGASNEHHPDAVAPLGKLEGVLEEILELSRRSQRILSNPTSMIPAEYLRGALQGYAATREGFEEHYLYELKAHVGRLQSILDKLHGLTPSRETVAAVEILRDIHEIILLIYQERNKYVHRSVSPAFFHAVRETGDPDGP
jgi:hypothetical protein